MSLPDELWTALRLEIEVVRARADYFAGYARSEAPLFDVSSLIRALRDGPIASGEQAVVSFFSRAQTGPIAEFRRRIADRDDGPRYPRWVRVAERADALRQAGMAELLYDTRTGVDTLMRSASEYRRLGLPFGSFLETAVTGQRDNAFEAGHRLRFVLDPRSGLDAVDDSLIPLDHALGAPAQQVAVLLTAMSAAEAIYEFETTSDILAAAAQAGASAPVGITAQPLALWWECGGRLADLAFRHAEARDELRMLIVELAAAHGLQLRNAQYDGFHWPAAAARVDLIDLDLAGLVAISARLLRQLSEPYWDMADDFDPLPPLAQVSIQVGLALAEQNGSESSAFESDPRPEPGPVFGSRPDYGRPPTPF